MGGAEPGAGAACVRAWRPLLDLASPDFTIPPTDPETPALIHFTSGTTGMPKGALHVHGAVVAHHVTGKLALDLHPDDVFWCTADPGWVTGISYGIIAPLSNGVTCLLDEADFDARRWYQLLAAERVTVWYTAPTAIRMLMKAGAVLAREYDLSVPAVPRQRGRAAQSGGGSLEPGGLRPVLSRQLVADRDWRNHDRQLRRHGGAARFDGPPAAGDRGRDSPAYRGRRGGGDHRSRTPWANWRCVPAGHRCFAPTGREPERYAKCFAGGFYLTGDLARRDADGYYWFVGRADDVIKTMGHLIGPFEVESVLLEHPAVAEAGVIGKPDPVAGELVKAFVALKSGFEPDDALRRDLLGFARTRLGAVVAPKEIAFLPAIPRTRSGKIMRRLLKARELGLPEGDTSTLEEPAHGNA